MSSNSALKRHGGRIIHATTIPASNASPIVMTPALILGTGNV